MDYLLVPWLLSEHSSLPGLKNTVDLSYITFGLFIHLGLYIFSALFFSFWVRSVTLNTGIYLVPFMDIFIYIYVCILGILCFTVTVILYLYMSYMSALPLFAGDPP